MTTRRDFLKAGANAAAGIVFCGCGLEIEQDKDGTAWVGQPSYADALEEYSIQQRTNFATPQDLKDFKGLEKDCKLGKSLGFTGKSLIHPDQISITHKIFYPTKSEIEWAEKVSKTYKEAVKKGKGATTVEGKMIDEVHFKQAEAILKIIKDK